MADLHTLFSLKSEHSSTPRWHPLPPSFEQREIKPQPDFAVVEHAHERGVLLELFPVTLLLAVEEFFKVGAFVAASLVIHNPAHAAFRF